MRTAVISGLIVLLATLRLATLSAQDMAAMSKWATAQVVHYHVSGDYAGTVSVLKGKQAGDLKAKISDHVEFDFDWDNLQQKLIGQPVIKNFPSKVAMEMAEWSMCPPLKVNGTYEYWTMDSITDMSMMFTLNGKMTTPPGSLPLPDPQEVKPCGANGWETIAATTPTTTARLQLPMGMMLVMPSTPGFEMEITPDKKSFIQKINTDGWVWTMTPTIVR